MSSPLVISANVPARGGIPTLPAAVWRAGELARSQVPVRCSGFARLNAELPGGGWPVGALVELFPCRPGVGECSLLRPVLGSAGRNAPVVFLQPPHQLYAPALLAWGLRPEQILCIRTETLADRLWALERMLRSGSCAAIIAWLPEVQQTALRRLQSVLAGSRTLLWLMRPPGAADQPSPAVLRIGLRPSPDGLLLDIFKRRGPPLAGPLHLPLATAGRLPKMAQPPDRQARSAPPVVPVGDAPPISEILARREAGLRHALARGTSGTPAH